MALGLEAFRQSDVCTKQKKSRTSDQGRQAATRTDIQGCTSPLEPMVKQVMWRGSFGLKSRKDELAEVNMTGGSETSWPAGDLEA